MSDRVQVGYTSSFLHSFFFSSLVYDCNCWLRTCTIYGDEWLCALCTSLQSTETFTFFTVGSLASKPAGDLVFANKDQSALHHVC